LIFCDAISWIRREKLLSAFGDFLRERRSQTAMNSEVSCSTMDSLETPLQDPTMTHQLFQLIAEMSVDEKRILLKILKGGSLKSKCRRQHLRKPLHMPVRYTNGDGPSMGVIRNISLGGVFISTRKALSPGQSLSVSFSPADFEKIVWITGDIMRVTPEGVGVKFRSMDQKQKTAVLTI